MSNLPCHRVRPVGGGGYVITSRHLDHFGSVGGCAIKSGEQGWLVLQGWRVLVATDSREQGYRRANDVQHSGYLFLAM